MRTSWVCETRGAGVELTRSGLLATLAILVVVGLCVRLGFWQLDRREQRMARNAAIAERLEAEPTHLTVVPTDTAGFLHRPATLRGRYDHDRTVVLGARSHRGVPGVYVLTPLQLHNGGAVLVNRGFIPSPDAATVDLGAIRRSAPDAVSGVLVPFPDVPPSPSDSFRTRWFRLDGTALRAQYPYRMAPLYLQEIGPSSGDPAAPGAIEPIPLDPPTLDAGPHMSYAVQWFGFAAVFLIGGIALSLRRSGSPGRAKPRRDA
jgi:surfeit locus 1 family protein